MRYGLDLQPLEQPGECHVVQPLAADAREHQRVAAAERPRRVEDVQRTPAQRDAVLALHLSSARAERSTRGPTCPSRPIVHPVPRRYRVAVSTRDSNASFVPVHAPDACTVAMAAATSRCDRSCAAAVMFMPNPRDIIQALDAASGDLLWQHTRPRPDDLGEYMTGGTLTDTNRNLSIHGKLIIDTSMDDHIFALHAETGEVVLGRADPRLHGEPGQPDVGPDRGAGEGVLGSELRPARGSERLHHHGARRGDGGRRRCTDQRAGRSRRSRQRSMPGTWLHSVTSRYRPRRKQPAQQPEYCARRRNETPRLTVDRLVDLRP